jgi:hypothetical protein
MKDGADIRKPLADIRKVNAEIPKTEAETEKIRRDTEKLSLELKEFKVEQNEIVACAGVILTNGSELFNELYEAYEPLLKSGPMSKPMWSKALKLLEECGDCFSPRLLCGTIPWQSQLVSNDSDQHINASHVIGVASIVFGKPIDPGSPRPTSEHQPPAVRDRTLRTPLVADVDLDSESAQLSDMIHNPTRSGYVGSDINQNPYRPPEYPFP